MLQIVACKRRFVLMRNSARAFIDEAIISALTGKDAYLVCFRVMHGGVFSREIGFGNASFHR